uniref:Uncharacterized protein n=1 Tax=Marseillevirus LCMAC101 TaxID=2506602 RepID=A0A481YS61_9VIRU|nr:MAG: hypothetical protein LCMAC101_06470 [Marseillevirus LCMAC101]
MANPTDEPSSEEIQKSSDIFDDKLEEILKLADDIDDTIKFLQDVGDEKTRAKVQELLDCTNKNLELILEKYSEDMEKLLTHS